MARSNTPGRSPRESSPAAAADVPVAEWITRAAFVLSLAVVLTRATMLESVRDALEIRPGAEPVPRAPGPATSLVLDLVAWLPALLVLARGAINRSLRIRLTWAHGLMIALAAWAVLSTAWADDKFSTLVSAFHFLSAAIFVWSTSQLVRSWRRLRLVAGVCVALLFIYGAQAFTYRLVDRAEMRRDWEQNREQRLRDRGLDPGSFAAQQFEAKLLRGEMMGFNASPNSFAAVTVLLVVVALGVVVQRRADGDGIGWLIPPAVGLTLGACIIVWCDSKTAFVTPVIAAGLLATVAFFREHVARHARLIYAAGIVCVVLGVAAVIGHGMYHGNLIIDSMTFRWRYWVGASRVFAGYPWLGVGWDNFGQHYLAARMPVAAEEIRDPHNFVVRFFAELGIAGGMLAVAWQARMWWELTQRPVIESFVESTTPRPVLPASSTVVAVAILLSVLATVDFGFIAIGGTVGSAFVILRLLERLAGGVLALTGIATTTARSMNDPNLDDRPAPRTLYAITAGLGVFMLHNLVDFAMFEAGPMFLFALLAGSAAGMRLGDPCLQDTASSQRHVVALVVAVVVWLAAFGALAVPVLIAEDHAATGDERLRTGSPAQAVQAYQDAAAVVPYNAGYWFQTANAALQGGAGPDQARQAFDEAIRTNPSNAGYHFSRAAFEARMPNPDVARVRASYDQALLIDSANVAQRLDYAATLEALGLPAEARKQYETALSYNDKLDPVEVERLSPSKLAELQMKIAKMPS